MNPQFRLGEDGLGRVVFDDPEQSQNVLTRQVMAQLESLIQECEEAAQAGDLRALLVESGKEGSFIAGADIAEIVEVVKRADREAAKEAARHGQAVMNQLAALPVPTVAAVRGLCLGGGAELALACDYRLGSDDERTRIGLPEVMLGILPAWGGTTRLPRLVGLSAALDLILTGKQLLARRAARLGLIDQLFPAAQFGERSRDFARALAHGGRIAFPTVRKRAFVTRFLDQTGPGRTLLLRAARRRVIKRTGGHYPAPLKALEVIGKGRRGSVETGLAREVQALGELAQSSVCRNLLALFQLRERGRKGPWAEGGQATDVGQLGVLGAGVMGGGIAQVAAARDVPVRVKDIRHEAVKGGLAYAKSIFDGSVARRKLRQRAARRKMALISGTLNYDGLSQADLVVECVVEKLEVKQAVLKEAETVVGPKTVLASNTSSLSIDDMAAGLARPERFAGMHFFNPVWRMPLVEVVRGGQTHPDTVETVARFAAHLGKVPVVTGDAPGFLVNRILGPYLNEAGHMLDEGLDAHQVDKVWRRFGMPMGPYRLLDEVGIDVARHAGNTLAAAFGDRLAPASALVALGKTERLGKKGGRGFYLYQGGKGGERFDPTVYADLGLSRSRTIAVAERVRDRLVLSMINEAARVLQEGVVTSAGEVDLGMIMGTGFPPFRGGLLCYADERGVAEVLRALTALADSVGERYRPCSLLAELGAAKKDFYEAFPWKR